MKKPKNSKIIINQTSDTLKFFFPPSGFRHPMTTVVVVMEMILSFPILLTAYGLFAADFPANIICGLFSFPFLGVAVGLLWFLPPFFSRKTYIDINPEQITFTHQMDGVESESPLVISRQNIIRLERTERHFVIEEPKSSFDTKQAILMEPDLIIRAGDEEYALRRQITSQLSEPEIDWLAYEISSWLEIPITKKASA